MSFGGSIPLIRRKILDQDKARVIQVFHECDLEKKGYLDREDIKVAVLSLFGYKPSKYEVEQLMGIGSKDKSQGLCIKRFQSLMFAKLSLEDSEQECRQIFNSFDAECKGFLTLQDFKYAFANVAAHLSESTVASCFRLLDKDGDGRISYRDFDFCLKHEIH